MPTLGLGLGLGLKSGGASGFSPADITGLAFWLDPSDAETLFQDEAGTTAADADDEPVGAWHDKSGNDWHLTSPNGVAGGNETNRPLLKTGIINGLQVIRTNGSISFMRKNSGVSLTGTELTVFVVTSREAFEDANEALMSLAEAGQDDHDIATGTVVGHSVSGNTPTPSGDISDSRENAILCELHHIESELPFIYTSKYDGVNQTGYIHGVPGTPVASTGSFNISRICIGFRNTAAGIGNPNNRNYGEILIYEGALSDEDREAVETYLKQKWVPFDAHAQIYFDAAGITASPAKNTLEAFFNQLKEKDLYYGLTGCWIGRSAFSVGSGTALPDLRSGALDGTLVNSPSWSANGLVFNAGNKAVTTGRTQTMNGSWSAFQVMRLPTMAAANEIIFSSLSGPSMLFATDATPANTRLGTYDGVGVANSDNAIDITAFSLIGSTYSAANTQRFYQAGAQFGSASVTNAVASHTVQLSSSGGSGMSNGTLAVALIYGATELTAQQVSDLNDVLKATICSDLSLP